MRGLGFLPGVLLAFVLIGTAARADVVALTNGDIENGTVAVETFVLDTPWGRVEIASGRVTRLSRRDEAIRIESVEGERFTGRLVNDELFLMRTFDPSLPIAAEDVAEIEFAAKPAPRGLAPAPDAVEAANGDRFRARVTTGVLTLDGEAVDLAGAFLVDLLAIEEDDPPLVQVTPNGEGAVRQGELAEETLAMTLRDGTPITVRAAGLATLALGVLRDGVALDFAYRRRIAPHAFLRDGLKDGTRGPEMVIVRGGPFLRGDRQGDGDFDEKPATPVTLPGPFAIGVTEVTFEQWDRYCTATRCGHRPDDSDWGRGRRPVINVSWLDVQGYLAWLSEQTGATYRLPTDAEWEFAARGGTASRFWWGDEPGTARANCSGCRSLWEAERTARVGKFPPNAFGLHDTAGNVFEWVQDCWHDTFAEAPADGSAIEKETGCGKRVIRGGAWSFPPKEMRSANRWRDFPSRRSDDTGFRVVRELDPR